MSSSQEALCARCSHLAVCKLKETYLKAQEAVNNAVINEEVTDPDGKAIYKTTYVTNLREWLTIPALKCAHYHGAPTQTFRNQTNEAAGSDRYPLFEET